jgi:hypothetical protein
VPSGALAAAPAPPARSASERLPERLGPADSSFARRIVHACGEAVLLIAVMWCVPLVILCVGLPVAAAIKFLLWIGGLF